MNHSISTDVEIQNRRKELVMLIADYLTDWTCVESDTLSVSESIEDIESYGKPYDSGSFNLVVNAIRHLKYHVNPFCNSALPGVLENVGFSADECNLYLG